MDPHFGGKPSMLSETAWDRPNRYRSEAPLFLAAYDQPLRTARKILLQVMSEEEPSGFGVEPISPTVRRIASLGGDSWQVRRLEGTVQLKRLDAAQLQATALDPNGYPVRGVGTAESITLQQATLYYLITR